MSSTQQCRTALHLAARRGRTDVIKNLLEESDADPNIQDQVRYLHI